MSEQNKTNLTARETELAILGWQAINGDFKIDYDKLARVAGFKNPETASVCFGRVKKKLLEGAAHVESAKKKAVKTPRKRKTADDTDENETPTKKRKHATPVKNLKVKGAAVKKDDDDEGDAGVTKTEDMI